MLKRKYYPLDYVAKQVGCTVADLIHHGVNNQLPIYGLTDRLKLTRSGRWHSFETPPIDDTFPENIITRGIVQLWVASLAQIETSGVASCELVERRDEATGQTCTYEVAIPGSYKASPDMLVITHDDLIEFEQRLNAATPEPIAPKIQLDVLTAFIDGKEAIPVRAIPFITGWKLSPDLVAKQLARQLKDESLLIGLNTTFAFHLQAGLPRKLFPKEWDAIVVKLAELDATLRKKYPDNERGYAAWRAEAPALLPAGAFVWRDEFENDFYKDLSPEAVSFSKERHGDRELIYSPLLTEEVRSTVLEGFDTVMDSDDDPDAEVRFNAGFLETILNGRAINWRYWICHMSTLSAAQAARLMSALDPDIFENLENRPNKNDSSKHTKRARDIQRLAENQNLMSATPAEWLEWAVAHGLNVHTAFFLEVDSSLNENSPAASKSGSLHKRAEAHFWPNSQCDGNTVQEKERQAIARREADRYTLEEAAFFIAESAEERPDEILAKLKRDVSIGKLDAYEPGKNQKYRFGTDKVTRTFYEEIYGEDLNKWLAENELKIQCQFSMPDSDADIAGHSQSVNQESMRQNIVSPQFQANVKNDETKIEKIKLPKELENIRKIKKSALVKRYRNQWPTVENDINEASRNELHVAQLGGGFYDELKALQWAEERGKFSGNYPATLPKSSIFDSPVSVKNRQI
jgi:hypothetical protein